MHEDVDHAVAALAARHAGRLQCRLGCAACCVDDITVFAVEAERIRGAHAALLEDGQPHPPGACAFLDGDGACRVYADRPYVCRTQGLPLRWFGEGRGDEITEQRDICPLNEPGPPLTTLPEDACWSIGPSESRLAAIADRYDPGMNRVALRTLFDED